MADSSSLGMVARRRLLPVADEGSDIKKGSLSIACRMKCRDEMSFVAAERTLRHFIIFHASEQPMKISRAIFEALLSSHLANA